MKTKSLIAMALCAGSVVVASAAAGESARSELSGRPDARFKHPRIASPLLEAGWRASFGWSPRAAPVAVAVHVSPEQTDALRRTLLRRGASVDFVREALIEARVPPAELARLADTRGVLFVGPQQSFEPDAVTGQGVLSTNARFWHEQGWTGRGVKIAIVDSGFAGYQELQAQGELPAQLDVRDLCGGAIHDSDHGSAVAEIVHEVAPEAELMLLCTHGFGGFSAAVDAAIAAGAKVISHSRSSYSSRADGRGGQFTSDAIVARARNAGILWVNSAGNYARAHWSGTFASADGDNWHDFDGTNELNGFGLDAGESGCVTLKWDDWPVSRQDYDLHLWERGAEPVRLRSAETRQTGFAPPLESVCYVNSSGARISLAAGIWRASATASPRFDLLMTGGDQLEYAVAAGSLGDEASLPTVVSVGAACWDTGLAPAYSSQGPTVDGRAKPDLAAPTGISNATYGTGRGCFGGFGGTSASAPHVAAAAALLWQRNPTATVGELESLLVASAVDAGAPGRDFVYGAGILRLAGAAPAAVRPPAAEKLSLQIASLTIAPRPVRAGRPLTVTLTLRRSDTGERAQSGTVSCRAWVRRAALKAAASAFANGLATCSWRIPAHAAGLPVDVTVTVEHDGATVARSLTLKAQ